MHKVSEFSVPDMDCASCVVHIEKDLSAKKGVHKVVANFATTTTQVTHDSDQISTDEIIKTLKKTGYEATLKSEGMHHGGNEMQGTDHGDHDGGDHSGHAQAENADVVKSRRNRFLFSLVLSLVILGLAFVVKVENGPMIMMVLSLLILIFSGREFYTRGIPSLLKGRPGMDTLVALGVGAAFLYSSYLMLFTDIHEEYFMDVAIIVTFILFGRYLEAISKGRASEAIRKLLELSAKVAHKVVGKKTVDIPTDDVMKGDLLLVKPGEKIPVDGVITKGSATINESMITGESIPADKEEGDPVIGATINGNTSFTMRAEKVGKDTVLSHIVKLVQEAQMSKAPIQKLVDVVSGYFVWGVLAIALITVLGWSYVLGEVSQPVVYMVAVLIIACPCALGLATPISIVVGSGKGATLGILLKRTESLELMHKVNAICFDKTGTLTKGEPTVEEFKSVEGDRATNLGLALALEESSEHPLAQSIVDYVSPKKHKKSSEVKSFKAITGKGVTGKISGKKYVLGSLRYMKDLKVDLEEVRSDVEKLQKSGHTVLFLSDGKKVLCYFGVRDTLKETSKKAVELLKKRGIEPVMVTGDNERVAQSIAKKLGIESVYAEVTPEDKVDIVSKLQKKGKVVAMVGDGINDSPALAKADVGLALGTGTDIAMESGDIVIVKGDLLKAVEAIELSRATLRNIKQNLFWAFIYNSVGIPIAALGFLNPIVSAGAMAFSSVSVVFNALRLRRFKVKL